jgi:hypothetical protein
MLAETAECLTSTACELKRIAPEEWLTSEETAAYHKKTTKSFDKIAASGTFPGQKAHLPGGHFCGSEVHGMLLPDTSIDAPTLASIGTRRITRMSDLWSVSANFRLV